jgi:hypothetical protein
MPIVASKGCLRYVLLGEQTRVSVGNPFRHSDSAVKPSVLAGRLEKPFRLFICRDLALWFEDLQCRKHFICRFEEVRAFFFFGTCERGAFLLIWAHPQYLFVCWLLRLSWASSCVYPPWLGVTLLATINWLRAASAERFFLHSPVLHPFFVLRERLK